MTEPMTDEQIRRWKETGEGFHTDEIADELFRLREFVAAVDKAFKANKNFIWVNGRHSFISKIRTARAKLDEEKK